MNPQLPIHLCKANAELQLQITRLLQESNQQWLDALKQLGSGSMQETAFRIDNLHQAADWQSLGLLPSEAFWRLFQGRLADTQAINQVAMKNQVAFSEGLRQALSAWQNAVSESVGDTAGSASMAQLSQQWMQPGLETSPTSKDKVKK